VDYGVTRTDYRSVAADLAKALKMNYAYGVEFLELDPLNLGLEKVEMEDKQAETDQVLQWIRDDHNPVILGGDLNTTGADNAPVSVSKLLTDRIKDPDKWAIETIKWSTGAPTILLMPVNMMRNKNDPTGFDVPVLSRKKEAKLFAKTERFRFVDGHVFDFRGESERSAEGRGGTLSDSNQRSGKGFRYTFALAKTYGGLVGEYKLDWFFVKGLATDPDKPRGKYQFSPNFGWTLMELNTAPDESLSNHAPMTVDVPLTEPPPLRASQP
jgi:hypothetical protein